jgi:hypothetical protein
MTQVLTNIAVASYYSIRVVSRMLLRNLIGQSKWKEQSKWVVALQELTLEYCFQIAYERVADGE